MTFHERGLPRATLLDPLLLYFGLIAFKQIQGVMRCRIGAPLRLSPRPHKSGSQLFKLTTAVSVEGKRAIARRSPFALSAPSQPSQLPSQSLSPSQTCVRLSQSTSVRPVSRSEMPAGSCTASSTVSSPMVRCHLTRLLVEETMPSTPSSLRQELASTFHAACSSTLR